MLPKLPHGSIHTAIPIGKFRSWRRIFHDLHQIRSRKKFMISSGFSCEKTRFFIDESGIRAGRLGAVSAHKFKKTEPKLCQKTNIEFRKNHLIAKKESKISRQTE